MNTYVFPGLWPFIERVARGRNVRHLGRARELWHGKQVQDALGQIPRLDPESRRQLIEHVCQIRAALAVALQGIDAAIIEVAREFDLLTTEAQAPEPSPAEPRLASHPKTAVHPDTRDTCNGRPLPTDHRVRRR